MNKNIKDLENKFTWGKIIKIHTIGNFQIVEYEDQEENKILYHVYVNFDDMNISYYDLESALIFAIAYNKSKNHNTSNYATKFFMKMLV